MTQKKLSEAVRPLAPARAKIAPPRFVWALGRARRLTPRLAAGALARQGFAWAKAARRS